MGPVAQHLLIVGWHDGITEGFIQGHDGRWQYASMVAWDPVQKLRIFAMVPADELTVAEIRALGATSAGGEAKATNWARIRARISDFLQTVGGDIEIRVCDQLDGETKNTRRIVAAEVLGQLDCTVEDAAMSTRFAEWMTKFGTRD
ncbi:MAG: hypothetical protein IPH07_17275 [Deltaproteobacteria bacterium]|nr:hypothetical protein [Deltaproteobacteria bacterium]MBK8719317.1 hypothetical protein [Deltaproteobacteria bacterium]